MIDRTGTEIDMEILKIVHENPLIKKTHIMYKCNLNSLQIRLHMNNLIGLDLVRKDDDEVNRGATWHLTDKGYHALILWKELNSILSPNEVE